MRTINEDDLTTTERETMARVGLHYFFGVERGDEVIITRWVTGEEARDNPEGHDVYRVVESENVEARQAGAPTCPLCGGLIELVKHVPHVYRLKAGEQEGDQGGAKWVLYDVEPVVDGAPTLRCEHECDLSEQAKGLGLPRFP